MRTMSHESFQRSENIRARRTGLLGLTFGVVFLIIGLYPWSFGRPVRHWGIGVAWRSSWCSHLCCPACSAR